MNREMIRAGGLLLGAFGFAILAINNPSIMGGVVAGIGALGYAVWGITVLMQATKHRGPIGWLTARPRNWLIVSFVIPFVPLLLYVLGVGATVWCHTRGITTEQSAAVAYLRPWKMVY